MVHSKIEEECNYQEPEKFPLLLQSKTDPDLVILAIKRVELTYFQGIVVASSANNSPVGTYNIKWIREGFERVPKNRIVNLRNQ